MIEIIFILGGLVALVAFFFVYIDLLAKGKIKPHIPPRYMSRDTTQRGNFWDAETKKFLQVASDRRVKKD